jgi:hypothetical protein
MHEISEGRASRVYQNYEVLDRASTKPKTKEPLYAKISPSLRPYYNFAVIPINIIIKVFVKVSRKK